MTIQIDKLSSGFLVTYWGQDYKMIREAIIKESDMVARVKELLKNEEGY